MRFGAIFSTVENSKVDSEAGIIRGVSVITEGEVKTHNSFADATTLSQVRDTALTHSSGVKVKMNHGDGVESIVGSLKNFRIEGKQLRADLHLLKSGEDYSKIIEMAQSMPDCFGLSISFSGDSEKVGSERHMRCKELYSVDLVDTPAANPSGLFSQRNNDMSNHQFVAKMLGLPETTSEEDVIKEFNKRTTPQQTAAQGITPEHLSAAVAAAVKPLNDQLSAIQTQSQAAVAAAEKQRRTELMAQAGREGKVIPLSDEEIYGTDKIAAVPLTMLESMVAKAPKTVSLSTTGRGMRPLNTDSKGSVAAPNGEVTNLSAEDRKRMVLEARARAVSDLTEHISRNGYGTN